MGGISRGESNLKSAIVSTYCEWSSMGSVLQAQALQEALESIDVVSTVLRKSVPILFFRKEKILAVRTLKQLLGIMLGCVDIPKKRVAAKKSEQYIRDNVRCINYSEYSEIENECPEADIYIAGSDQIWHPNIDRRDFFLDYVPSGKKCISYAASMGILDIGEEKKREFVAKLQRFAHISVREYEVRQLFRNEMQLNVVDVHIDPTFLRTATAWRKYAKQRNICKPYILVYPIYWDNEANAALKKLQKQTGYDVISIHSGIQNIYCTKQLKDVDPGEFLWLIDHAECVVTSSFHGVAFSIIFNKKFSAVINPKAPSRIQSILKLLDINPPEIEKCASECSINYEKVNELIEYEKVRSIDYLRSAVYDEK